MDQGARTRVLRFASVGRPAASLLWLFCHRSASKNFGLLFAVIGQYQALLCVAWL